MCNLYTKQFKYLKFHQLSGLFTGADVKTINGAVIISEIQYNERFNSK